MAKRARKKGYAKAEWFLIGVFCVAGLVGALIGGTSVWRGWQSRGWPTVEGTITKSEVEVVASGVGGSGATHTPYHRPDVEYSYWVDDKEYTGTRIFFGSPEKFSQAHAGRIAKAYPVGREVMVACDPAQPGNAVLEPGLVWEGTTFTIAIAMGGALVLIVGLLAVANGLWKAFGKKAEHPGQMD